MARINIEERLWKDFRFQELMIKVGSRHAAKGMVLELWLLAQEYWYPDKKYIPEEKLRESGLQPVIDVGLAELKSGGYFAIGSEKAFDWLFAAQKAGEASADSRNKKAPKIKKTNQRGSTDVEPTLNVGQPTLNVGQPTLNVGQPTLNVGQPTLNVGQPTLNVGQETFNGSQAVSTSSSSSSSSSFLLLPSSESSSQSLFSKGELSEGTSSEIKSPVGLFIANYCKAYGTRYPGGRPDLRGKIQGLIKTFVNETPIERACELIRTYCEMNDQWFITKAHDFVTFQENLSKVGLKLDTGQSATRKDAQNAEVQSYHQQQLARIAGGSQ